MSVDVGYRSSDLVFRWQTEAVTSTDPHPEVGGSALVQRWDQIEANHSQHLSVALIARWRQIGGRSLGWSMALNFFLSVTPVVVIATSLLGSLRRPRSYGDLLVGSLGLRGSAAQVVSATFKRADGHTFTALGLSGLLFIACGLDLATAGQNAFARAWQRKPDVGWRSIFRGLRWFFGFALATIIGQSLVFLTKDKDTSGITVDVLAFIVVQFFFWLATPRLLVDHALPFRDLLPTAVVGTLVSGGFRIASAFVLPGSFGWYADAFGPAGVVMAVVSWYLLQAFGWVFTAVAGAILAERRAAGVPTAGLQAPRTT
jgi:uncharacterized BrkB/YihY/UPF0761 family membrane protein